MTFDKRKSTSHACSDEKVDEQAQSDALARFRQEQARKCSVHNRKQTQEVLALIRRHRKE